ncbi:MAG: FHA domain-containing protein [Methylococcales bacterium]|nr:FHA domain-containing protein [Methylococcales bacterium]
MSEFVRICPKCQTQNPEYEHICNACGHFIAMESPTAVPVNDVEPNRELDLKPEPDLKQEDKAPQTQLKTEPPAIYLELQSNDKPLFTVKSGWFMGQSYVNNQAEIQIDREIEGSEYVHRRHCRFICKKQLWYVQALDQKRYQGKFTNPTNVNSKTLPADKARQIKNGDVLSLSGLSFQVKIVSTLNFRVKQISDLQTLRFLSDKIRHRRHFEFTTNSVINIIIKTHG